jgi:hypothetical protein
VGGGRRAHREGGAAGGGGARDAAACLLMPCVRHQEGEGGGRERGRDSVFLKCVWMRVLLCMCAHECLTLWPRLLPPPGGPADLPGVPPHAHAPACAHRSTPHPPPPPNPTPKPHPQTLPPNPPKVVQQICLAYRRDGGTAVVVLTQREKLEMEDLFRWGGWGWGGVGVVGGGVGVLTQREKLEMEDLFRFGGGVGGG